MWLFLAIACRPPTELNPVTLAGTGYILEQATFDLEHIRFAECETEKVVDATLYRRFSLMGPGPIRLPDRSWCSLELDFPEGRRGIWLSGRIRRDDDTPLRFSYQLDPGILTQKQAFYGDRYELALVLDPDVLIQPTELLAVAAASDPPAEVLAYGLDSAESRRLVERLPEALWVGNLPEAELKYGRRWTFVPTDFERTTDVYVASGCTTEVSQPWDTSVYQGFLDTGGPVDSTVESGPPDSDTHSDVSESGPVYHDYPETTGCGGSQSDTSGTSDTSDTSRSDTAGTDTSDSSDSGSSSGGCDCGGSGGDSGGGTDSPADSRAGLLLGAFTLWRLRRRLDA
jgi:hypothetical protein